MQGEIVTHILNLLNRVGYIDRLTEERGFSYHRNREQAALWFAIEFIAESYPDEHAEAKRVLAARGTGGV